MSTSGYYKGPARPADVARYGHTAAAIRAALDKHKLTVLMLQDKLGMAHSNSAPYWWLNAKGAPSEPTRTKLAKILGIPLADLTPKGELRRNGDAKGASGRPRPPAVIAAAPALAPLAVAARRPVFTFSVTEAGEARIQFDVSMPADQAWPLVRLLADHGLIQSQRVQDG